MADGNLVPKRLYAKLLDMARRDHRTPAREYIPKRRRDPIFQPAAGSKVYHVVSGTKLKLGTVTQPEKQETFDPVCLAIELGRIGDTDLVNLLNDTVFKLQAVMKSLGIVGQASNNVLPQVYEDERDNDQITSLVNDDIGSETGVTMLRTRFCQGYVPTGAIVVGSDDEAWYGTTLTMASPKIVSNWTSGANNKTAKLTINQESIDNHVATDAIYDYVSVRDPLLHPLYIASGTAIVSRFKQQETQSDDWSFHSDFWYEDSDLGWLPVFEMLNSPVEFRGKATGDVASAASGSAVIWAGATEAATSVAVSNILNDTSCTVKGTPQFCTFRYVNNLWQFTVFRSS